MDASEVKAALQGRWVELFTHHGIPADCLDGRHHPCPRCGGRDRFRVLDAERGSLFCNQCFRKGGGDGLAALQWWLGCDFRESLRVAAEFAGLAGGKSNKASEGNGKAKQANQVFPTANDALQELKRRLGPPAAKWVYADAAGNPVGVVARWDTSTGKNIRPVSRCDGGWRIGQMPAPRPMYNLPAVLQAAPEAWVWVTEGEKCTDALTALGLTATTSSGGANAAAKTDWSPLRGRRVVILPDNDEPGRQYAQTVAKLAHAADAKEIRILDLGQRFPDLPQGFDVADLVENPTAIGLAEGTPADELRKLLEEWADEAPAWKPDDSEPSGAPLVEPYEPFPVDALPEPLRRFVVEGAEALQCDHAHLALPLLTVVAAAIGNTRRLRLKRDWLVPPILWAVVVAESGGAKTPALRLVLRPVRERQREALERYEEAKRKYEAAVLRYEKDLAEWRRSKDTMMGPPEKPEPPKAERFIVSDTTLEALAPLLLENPRGLLLASDELSAWIGSFDRYVNTKGGDLGRWLGIHAGECVIVDRKTEPRTIFVPSPCLSICGGIQPSTLTRLMATSYRDCGLAARILWAYPPKRRKRWTEADINPATQAAVARLIDRLYTLQPTTDERGNISPVILDLTPEAKELWANYYNAHADEWIDLSGELASAWAKLEEAAVRLALVIHCTRLATRDATTDAVDAVSMQSGITLATWFKREARRVHALFTETDEEADQRRLIEWIEARGGAATVRDLTHGLRRFRNQPGAAEAALTGLVKAGLGHWESPPSNQKGGRPTRVFRLVSKCHRHQNPPKRPKYEGFGDGDSGDTETSRPPKTETPSIISPTSGSDAGATGVPTDGSDDDGDWLEITL